MKELFHQYPFTHFAASPLHKIIAKLLGWLGLPTEPQLSGVGYNQNMRSLSLGLLMTLRGGLLGQKRGLLFKKGRYLLSFFLVVHRYGEQNDERQDNSSSRNEYNYSSVIRNSCT